MLKINLLIVLYLFCFFVLKINGTNAKSNYNLIEGRVINGTDASLRISGHQVSIRRRKEDSESFGNGHICGGSLISENVVLCAAHCFVDGTEEGNFLPDKDFMVAMGDLDRTKKSVNTLVFDIIETVKYGKNFNTSTLVDDIALIILNGTVPTEHPTIKQISLNEGSIKNNTLCHVTGWGLNENYVRPEKLQIVDQPFIDIEDCRNLYNSFIHDGMICAGVLEGGRSPCSADSGGPLVCGGIQAGVVSFSEGCAKPLAPVVYADVSYYKDWILKLVTLHNGTLPTFAVITDD